VPHIGQPVALSPDNTFHQFDLTGNYIFSPTIRSNFKLSYGRATQDHEFSEMGLAGAPAGVPDNFGDHVKIMFDLQVLALQSDMTRVFSFKMGRDASARVYPDSGVATGFHPASHHGNNPARVKEFAEINRYHVSLLPYLLDKLKTTMDGDTPLLENTTIVYGSPMSDSNTHNHRRCPLILLGGGHGIASGNQHLKAPDGTPMANVMLSLMHKLGMDDMQTFGDSTGAFAF
jgi:hypothetical protein